MFIVRHAPARIIPNPERTPIVVYKYASMYAMSVYRIGASMGGPEPAIISIECSISFPEVVDNYFCAYFYVY